MSKAEVVKVSTGRRIRISDKMAQKLGISDGDYVALTFDSNSMRVKKLNLPSFSSESAEAKS